MTVLLDAHAFLWHAGTMTDLGVIPGGFTSEAYAINSHNQIVGKGRVLRDGVALSHPFLWEQGQMTDLGTLPDLPGTLTPVWHALADRVQWPA